MCVDIYERGRTERLFNWSRFSPFPASFSTCDLLMRHGQQCAATEETEEYEHAEHLYAPSDLRRNYMRSLQCCYNVIQSKRDTVV